MDDDDKIDVVKVVQRLSNKENVYELMLIKIIHHKQFLKSYVSTDSFLLNKPRELWIYKWKEGLISNVCKKTKILSEYFIVSNYLK